MLVMSGAVAFWDDTFDRAGIAEPVELPNYLDRAIAFFGPVAGRSVLDIGCGLGENAIVLARMGAHVTAIDTSAVAIRKINEFAAAEGLPIVGVVCDAMKLDGLGRFDFVLGAMILHHLEPFSAFCSALKAALKPGGKAFFYENNAASRLLVWCRQNLAGKFGIPKYGDDDEFPLTPQEVDHLRAEFRVEQVFPQLVFFQMAALYCFRGRGGHLLARLDALLFRAGIMRSYSYRQLLLVERLA
jgi:SAM-dependent methyltransferase